MNILTKQRGLLVVIDGTDSSGKESVSRRVVSALKDQKLPATRLTFPNYESPSSSLVKMYLNGNFGKTAEDVNPYTASTFYAVDRIASYLSSWKKDYEEGVIIVSDRYVSSNEIHQASKFSTNQEKVDYLNWLYDLEYKKLGLPIPDITIFLDMPFEKSWELMKQRKEQGESALARDIHEENASFMRNSYANAKWVANFRKWEQIPCTKIENNSHELELRSLDNITKDVLGVIYEKRKSHYLG